MCFFFLKGFELRLELLPSGHQIGIAGKSWMKFPAKKNSISLGNFPASHIWWTGSPMGTPHLVTSSITWMNSGPLSDTLCFRGLKTIIFCWVFCVKFVCTPQKKGNHCPIQICNFGLSQGTPFEGNYMELHSSNQAWHWKSLHLVRWFSQL